MDQKDLKKFLAGLSITTLVAGASIIGMGFPKSAQAAWSGSIGSGRTESVEKGMPKGGDIQRGKELFNEPTLGGSTNDKSCNTCHPDGKGLEKFSGNLESVINACIQRALGGEALDMDSQDMKDLSAYIASLKK